MSNPVVFQSVAAAVADYLAHVLPADAGAVQVEETRRAFYAGAYFLLMNLAHNLDDDSDEDAGAAALEQIKQEIERFARARGANIGKPTAPVITGMTPIAPDVSYTTSDAAEYRPLLQKLGGAIGHELPAGVGFTLLLFHFGPGGSLFYISNAERADVLQMMREFLRKQVS